jgi:outer membrane lipoprotein LolB
LAKGYKMIKKYLKVLLLTILLSSCTQTIVDEVAPIQLNPQQLKQLSKLPIQWELKGRLAIIHNEENWHARFHWIKDKNKFQLRFTGPLGETHLLLEQKIINNIKTNILTMGEETYTSSESIDEFLYSYTQILIPVKSLQYWIFGHYNPEHPYRIKKLSSEDSFLGSIKELFQESWQIQFSKYASTDGFHYPAKIIAKDGEYKIKIFISSRLDS